jgi:hypothetical protein
MLPTLVANGCMTSIIPSSINYAHIWIKTLTTMFHNHWSVTSITKEEMIKEEDLKELLERVFQQKMEELFEEPSTYEDENDE